MARPNFLQNSVEKHRTETSNVISGNVIRGNVIINTRTQRAESKAEVNRRVLRNSLLGRLSGINGIVFTPSKSFRSMGPASNVCEAFLHILELGFRFPC